MPVRFSHWWMWTGFAVVVFAALFIRLLPPHHVHAPASQAIPDRSSTSPLNQPGGGAVSPEAYEIYSALYAGLQPESLAFAEDSVTDIPQVDGSCLKPSNAEEQEMAADFEAANKQSHLWERRFSISSNYLLLSRSDAARAQSCIQARNGMPSADCASYLHLRHVRYLGLPGFNHSHTRALVSVIKMCGEDCGSGGIFEVRRSGATWRRAGSSDLTRDCSWMY